MRKTFPILLFLLIGFVADLTAQVLFNNGAQIQATGGAYIYVNGSVRNAAAGQMNIDETAGTPAEMFVSQNITNDATLLGDGRIRLLGNWYNNSIFTSGTGTVLFEGGNQLLGGSVASAFYNLTLDGSGLKTQAINQSATGVLDLKHLELQTETYAFFMQNSNPNAIIRTTGFVSSLNGGYLSRNTNTAVAYLFPVGSSLGVTRYRPVEITPTTNAANTYTARLANVNATTEGYSVNAIDPDICQVNPLFYHQIDRTAGATAAKLDIFFDAAADGNWEGLSKWMNPGNIWDIVAGSTVNAGVPFSVASKTAWNDFSTRPYILHRSNVAPSFNPLGPYCVGETPAALPATSLNGIPGTWNPAVISTSAPGTTTYTFTPSAGACAYVYTMNITVNATPPLNLGSDQNVCVNNVPVTLDAGAGMTTYLWSTGVNTQTIQVSVSGNYSVTVTNANGCSASDSKLVTVNPLPNVSINALAPQYCANAGLVPLSGTPAGGSFSGPGVSGGNFNPALAGAGVHTISYTYTDLNGCSNSATAQTEVTTVPELSVDAVVMPGCNGSANGSISLDVNGGTPNFVFTWNPVTGTNGPTATNLIAGTYNITVEDAYGCSDDIQVVLTEPSGMNLTVTINNHVNCFGESNGSAVASVTGGSLPYSYTWNYDNSHQAFNNNLPAGTWSVTVFDANGCQVFEQFTITEPNALSLQFSNVQNVSCAGMADGAAIAIVTGGTGPYSYDWDDPGNSTQATASNLPAGMYHVTVTDAHGCTITNQILITEPVALQVAATSQPVQCGITLGSASAQVIGGTMPYSYSWTGGSTSQQALGLISGTYTVLVSDANSCTASAVVYVGMQGTGVVHITETQPILCNGESNAVLTAEMINGISPVSYLWSNSATGATVQNLSAGIYSVTATDSWGCSGSQSQMISQPTAIFAASSATPVSCYGGNNGSASVNVSGGTAPYTYFWSNGSSSQSLADVVAGNYVLTITDSHNCTLVSNVVVNQPDAPVTLNMVVTHISCFGEHDGAVNLNVTGGTPPYSYEWLMGTFTTNEEDITNLYEGMYNLTVTDANACVTSTIAVVSQPAALSATWVSGSPSCIGNHDGYIEVAAVGGTEPYQFAWSGGVSPVFIISGLVEGEYMVTVVDARACTTEIGPIVLTDRPEDCIRIPNAFTPNGDGINDTWIIENVELYPDSYVQVFNRWGQALYEAKGSEEPWDGTYNGKPVPTAPYIYIFNFLNGEEPRTGIVTVVR
ncbi:MAG TPA: gliding motility-associated C-terminal domain-containing protein [Bacteroidales bacterium]|nr:gliding motility-associated C-terminal domain-containing protein [Bacteroidales bacterium]